jgi:hypothetical protein
MRQHPVNARRGAFWAAWQRHEQRRRGHVIPPSHRVFARTRADKDVQRRTAIRRRRLGKYVEEHACRLLDQGVPLDVLLDSYAPGAVGAQAWFAGRYGITPSRTTLAEDFRAVLGEPTGTLPQALSLEHGAYVQAHTFSLRRLDVTLGPLGRKITARICNHALGLERGSGRRGTVNMSVSPVSVLRRARRALQRALEQAVAGNRHLVGVRLAWRLAHLGLDEADAHTLLSEYQATVARSGSRLYERREARRAVSSAYRKLT